MVLEEINTEWLLRRPYIAFFLGFIYALIGYVLATLFFLDNKVSVAMLFLTTLFLIPTLVGVLRFEEKVESRQRLGTVKNFFLAHKHILTIYILIFVGAFFGYIILGFLAQDQAPVIFQYQLEFLNTQEGIDMNVVESFFSNTLAVQAPLNDVVSILQNNLAVMLICFFLSVVFGAGGIFLLILNASIFASFGVMIIKFLTTKFFEAIKITLIYSLHLIPEIGGFIIVAIAGGVLSRAILTEEFGSDGFRNVVRDSLMLFLLGCVLVIIAAFLEVYVTRGLFQAF